MAGGDVKLPGIGALPRKQVYVALGAAVLIGGVMYYRKRQAASTAASTTATTAATDPQTGYPVGSPEDQAALAALSASAGTGGAYGGGSGTITTPTPVAGTGLTTNAQWSQTVIDYFTNTLSQDSAAIAGALGKYLAGQQLTPTEAELIHQAIALEGQAPVAAADGYPPNLRLTAATTGGGNTGTDPWTLAGHAVGPTEIDLTWNKQPAPWSGYRIQYGVSGNLTERYNVGNTNTARIGALHPHTAYSFSVVALSGGVVSPPSPQIQIATPA